MINFYIFVNFYRKIYESEQILYQTMCQIPF